jgi:hypothetical protein
LRIELPKVEVPCCPDVAMLTPAKSFVNTLLLI